jgi:hypothetical protein
MFGGEDGGAVYDGVAVAIAGGTKIVGSPGGGAVYPSEDNAAIRAKVRRPQLTANERVIASTHKLGTCYPYLSQQYFEDQLGGNAQPAKRLMGRFSLFWFRTELCDQSDLKAVAFLHGIQVEFGISNIYPECR